MFAISPHIRTSKYHAKRFEIYIYIHMVFIKYKELEKREFAVNNLEAHEKIFNLSGTRGCADILFEEVNHSIEYLHVN
jgi:hypothetical protein